MKRLIIALLAVYPLLSQGQDMKELYQKADSFYTKYSSMSRGLSDIEAIKNSPKFWYSARTANGKEFFLLDAEKKQEPTPAFDQKRLALSLETFLHKEIKAYQLPFQKIRFAGTDTLSFIIDKQEYLCTLADYKIIKGAAIPEDSYWGGVYRENSKEKIKSPDGINEAYAISQQDKRKRSVPMARCTTITHRIFIGLQTLRKLSAVNIVLQKSENCC